MPSELTNNYYISHVSGGTGGAGGRGRQEGGGGGAGHGPSFQAETIVIQNDPEERQKIIKWASPLNFFPRQADILSTHQAGTGEWFLLNDLFKKWRVGEIGALWCRGIPGAGKTVLTSIVVDDLRRNLLNEDTGVAALYLDHKASTETHSTTNLLAAVWQQLILTKPISSRACELYKKHHAQGTRPSLEEIYSMLHSAIQEFSRVFVVIDALDEYPEEHRDTLLRCLWRLEPVVGLMLTSRPHINIAHVISNINTVEIRAIEKDIRKYVEAQIDKSPRLSRHILNFPSLRESIEEKIVKRSDGMFLLAKLHVGSLTSKQNIAAVRDALANLSSNLDNAYDDIVIRINQQSEDDRRLAWRTLSWVVHAKTALQPSRLKEALAVEAGATDLDPERQTDMDIVMSVCAGLVVINKEDDKVRLIHYTTDIYFHSSRLQTSMFPHAQSEISLTCFTYMSLTFRAFPSLLQHEALLFTYNSFLHYTVEYCLVHARGDPEIEISDSILSFLTDCAVWWRLWNWKHGGRQSAPHKLRIAMSFHLELISRYIIDKEGLGVLLQEAVARGATGEVRDLVQNGVDLKKDGDALLEAVINDHEEIVGILLAHDVGNTCHGESVELDGATSEQLVITKGQNHYGAALYQASSTGKEAVAKLLIKHGADVDAEAEESSALEMALWHRHEGIAQLLIQHGANVNAKSSCHDSLLHLAVEKGFSGISKLLIEHGANVNAEAEKSSALEVALWHGHEEIAQLLIQHGANVNAKSSCHDSLLYLAVEKGFSGLSKLLIEHGADIDMATGKYGSVLGGACRRGQEDIVRLLLYHGADIRLRGEYGGALEAAVLSRNEVIVQLLLKCSADLGAMDGEYSSALKAALSQGNHEAAAQLLLEHGAEELLSSDSDSSISEEHDEHDEENTIQEQEATNS